MMTPFHRPLLQGMLILLLGSLATVAVAKNVDEDRNVLEKVVETDGTEALAAAVLLVDEAGVLPWSLAGDLANPHGEYVLFAPSNTAFETLLGLPPGTLEGLSIDEIKHALPGILSGLGLGAEQVGAILLKHYAVRTEPVSAESASARALLAKGIIWMVDGSGLPLGVGATGIVVNGETTVTVEDNFVSNGVVHYIDRVIVDDLL